MPIVLGPNKDGKSLVIENCEYYVAESVTIIGDDELPEQEYPVEERNCLSVVIIILSGLSLLGVSVVKLIV